jgi:hypothetical protein
MSRSITNASTLCERSSWGEFREEESNDPFVDCNGILHPEQMSCTGHNLALGCCAQPLQTCSCGQRVVDLLVVTNEQRVGGTMLTGTMITIPKFALSDPPAEDRSVSGQISQDVELGGSVVRAGSTPQQHRPRSCGHMRSPSMAFHWVSYRCSSSPEHTICAHIAS